MPHSAEQLTGVDPTVGEVLSQSNAGRKEVSSTSQRNPAIESVRSFSFRGLTPLIGPVLLDISFFQLLGE
jgi:hypothetical protein